MIVYILSFVVNNIVDLFFAIIIHLTVLLYYLFNILYIPFAILKPQFLVMSVTPCL